MKSAEFIDSLRLRLFWIKYGVPFFSNSRFQVKKVRIGNRLVRLSIPAGEEKMMSHEFKTIFYDDCYGLRKVEGPVKSILDVGSNLGFFSLAAKSHFPAAKIHSYEPNPQIQSHLLNNTRGLSIDVHPEAIGGSEGWIDLKTDGGSLFATGHASEKGTIKKVPLATAIERIGGSVDLLKLDCEGAEWELFEQPELWKSVNRLTMEFHLWANPKIDLLDMIKLIRGFGFRIVHLNESEERKWGILHATRI